MPNSRMKSSHRHKPSAPGSRRLERSLKHRTRFQDKLHESHEKSATKRSLLNQAIYKKPTGAAKRLLRRALHLIGLKDEQVEPSVL